ncbi:hypothetical protein RJ639_043060 [Escallonia herrerae]|uniref:Mitochondrial import inner membrane translocase subunit n=1 Tax=Escallonia herrerae TaxID=1293975 RepID=A0AA88WFC6_9ASTE|nr:hypothetical protein RJ639_043060 [Escallonia herrerae]
MSNPTEFMAKDEKPWEEKNPVGNAGAGGNERAKVITVVVEVDGLSWLRTGGGKADGGAVVGCRETVRGKCFDKCITKPGSSLSGSESSCVSRCVDRYIEATGALPENRCMADCDAPSG